MQQVFKMATRQGFNLSPACNIITLLKLGMNWSHVHIYFDGHFPGYMTVPMKLLRQSLIKFWHFDGTRIAQRPQQCQTVCIAFLKKDFQPRPKRVQWAATVTQNGRQTVPHCKPRECKNENCLKSRIFTGQLLFRSSSIVKTLKLLACSIQCKYNISTD